MSFGPEQVEEKRGAEDGCNRDPDENVIRGSADEVVVVDFGFGVLLLDGILLVEII